MQRYNKETVFMFGKISLICNEYQIHNMRICLIIYRKMMKNSVIYVILEIVCDKFI